MYDVQKIAADIIIEQNINPSLFTCTTTSYTVKHR